MTKLTLAILAVKRWRKTRLEALAEYHQGKVDTYERCVKEGAKVSGSLLMALAHHTGKAREYRHLAASIKVCLTLLAVGLSVGGWADTYTLDTLPKHANGLYICGNTSSTTPCFHPFPVMGDDCRVDLGRGTPAYMPCPTAKPTGK